MSSQDDILTIILLCFCEHLYVSPHKHTESSHDWCVAGATLGRQLGYPGLLGRHLSWINRINLCRKLYCLV